MQFESTVPSQKKQGFAKKKASDGNSLGFSKKPKASEEEDDEAPDEVEQEAAPRKEEEESSGRSRKREKASGNDNNKASAEPSATEGRSPGSDRPRCGSADQVRFSPGPPTRRRDAEGLGDFSVWWGRKPRPFSDIPGLAADVSTVQILHLPNMATNFMVA